MWQEELLPKDDAIADRLEERICVGIHRQDMLAVRVFFQSCVDPVHKGISFLLCSNDHKEVSVKQTIEHGCVTLITQLSGSRCPWWISATVSGEYISGDSGEEGLDVCVHLPEYECCVPSLESSDVPPMAKMPSFLLMTLRKVFATSLSFSSWTI